MTSKESFVTWNFIFFILVSFYSMGAGCVESLVNYPLWHIIGPSDVWTEYHVALGPKIIAVLAIPALLLQLISNILLFFFRPVSISRQAVWLALILLSVALISSAIIQIPIQARLDAGYSKELVDRLIKTDLLFRISVTFLRSSLIVIMLYRIFQKSAFSNQPAHIQNKTFRKARVRAGI